MAWCPNCKTEYREGILMCSDCGATLTETLEETEEKELLISYEKEKLVLCEKLVLFLENEGISGVECLEEDDRFSIVVPTSQIKRSEKIASVFSRVEAEKEFSDLDEEEKRRKLSENAAKIEKERNTHIYTKASERYKDNVSTAWTFLIIGLLGLGFTILNLSGIFHFMAGAFQYIVSFLMFLAFIGLGIFSFTRNKKLEALIKSEENDEARYKSWLRSLPIDTLREMIQTDASDEENEIVLINELSKKLVATFPELDENFADMLADDFFNEISSSLLKNT